MDKYKWSRMAETCFMSGVCMVMAFKQSCWADLCRIWKATPPYCTLLYCLCLIHLYFILFSPPPVLDQLPFMMMSHPLIPASLAPASVSMAMGQMNRLNTLASMANVAHLHAKPPARAPTSVIKVNSEAHQPGGADHQPASVHVTLRNSWY